MDQPCQGQGICFFCCVFNHERSFLEFDSGKFSPFRAGGGHGGFGEISKTKGSTTINKSCLPVPCRRPGGRFPGTRLSKKLFQFVNSHSRKTSSSQTTGTSGPSAFCFFSQRSIGENEIAPKAQMRRGEWGGPFPLQSSHSGQSRRDQERPLHLDAITNFLSLDGGCMLLLVAVIKNARDLNRPKRKCQEPIIHCQKLSHGVHT